MNRRNFQKVVLASGLALGARSALASNQVERQQRMRWEFDGITFENTFSGARLNDLLRIEKGRYLAISRPEVRPINPSPWYAFAIHAHVARSIELMIRVDSSDDQGSPLQASRPWISHDGEIWKPLAEENWKRAGVDAQASLKLTAGLNLISAWKPFTLERIDRWVDKLAGMSFVSERSIGLSREGRPLRQLEIGEGTKRRSIVILGGQHPPEITGNLGLEAFVEEICAEHETARRFRQSYRTVVIPMINPDGKHHGHWRCTTGGVDPNRDWFALSQSEVRAVARHLARLKDAGGQVCFGVDFHSTNRDFVYVESPDAPPEMAEFTRAWSDRCASLPDGEKLEQESGRPLIPCSREWMSKQLQCPSYTREFRYDQDEAEVRRKSRIEALAVMHLLLGGA